MMRSGQSIPVLRVLPDRYLPYRYAGAAEDFNPVHIDPQFARSVGLPGNILHGLYGMALVARANLDAVGGAPQQLKSLSVQFRGMAVPEQEIVVTGAVSAIDNGHAVIKTAANQGETGLIREGVARLALAR